MIGSGRSGRGPIVAIEGPSAAGKSEAARRVALRSGAHRLDEAVERIRPVPSLRFASPGELLTLERILLAEESRRYRSALRTALAGGTVIADTGFLGPLTYTLGLVVLGLAPKSVLDQLLRDAASLGRRGGWGLPDAIVYLDTPAAERLRRAARDPRGHPRSLRARHEAVGRVERTLYRTVLAPELGLRFHLVAGRGEPDAVANRLAAIAAQCRPRASSDRDASRVLGLIASFASDSLAPSLPRRRGNR